MHGALIFLAGLISGMGIIGVWFGLRLLADAKAAGRVAEAALHALHGTVKDGAAQEVVKECKRRMRWQKNLNPEWIDPLIREIPRLVREIASVYYPADPQPLLAPGLSQFTRAVHLAALDIADFLQTRTIGRLVDVSANTAIKAINKGRKVVENEHFQSINKWYKRLLPVWQAARFNSPVMWASLAVANVAVRALQPAVVDIVARRAIELYSGRLAAGKELPAIIEEAGDEIDMES
ncbi:MAG: hypothetical protein JWO89_1607 [Verrucomicrobiaceae bacterium]|nr:hypothetical protein [Verrucomicrobiaceae bacterium]